MSREQIPPLVAVLRWSLNRPLRRWVTYGDLSWFIYGTRQAGQRVAQLTVQANREFGIMAMVGNDDGSTWGKDEWEEHGFHHYDAFMVREQVEGLVRDDEGYRIQEQRASLGEVMVAIETPARMTFPMHLPDHA